MLLPTHKYIVDSCSGMLNTNSGNHQYVRVKFIKPAPTDEFGEKFMDDDVFEATAWNKKALEMPVLQKGDKVEAQLALRGKDEISKNDGSTWNRLQLTIMKVEKIH